MATSVTNAVATDAVAILLLNLPGDTDRKCLYGPAEVLGDEFPVDEVALLFQVATKVASDGRASKALCRHGSMRPRDVVLTNSLVGEDEPGVAAEEQLALEVGIVRINTSERSLDESVPTAKGTSNRVWGVRVAETMISSSRRRVSSTDSGVGRSSSARPDCAATLDTGHHPRSSINNPIRGLDNRMRTGGHDWRALPIDTILQGGTTTPTPGTAMTPGPDDECARHRV